MNKNNFDDHLINLSKIIPKRVFNCYSCDMFRMDERCCFIGVCFISHPFQGC